MQTNAAKMQNGCHFPAVFDYSLPLFYVYYFEVLEKLSKNSSLAKVEIATYIHVTH
jgi:hypothetical protein